jgi:hypothetical protein
MDHAPERTNRRFGHGSIVLAATAAGVFVVAFGAWLLLTGGTSSTAAWPPGPAAALAQAPSGSLPGRPSFADLVQRLTPTVVKSIRFASYAPASRAPRAATQGWRNFSNASLAGAPRRRRKFGGAKARE